MSGLRAPFEPAEVQPARAKDWALEKCALQRLFGLRKLCGADAGGEQLYQLELREPFAPSGAPVALQLRLDEAEYACRGLASSDAAVAFLPPEDALAQRLNSQWAGRRDQSAESRWRRRPLFAALRSLLLLRPPASWSVLEQQRFEAALAATVAHADTKARWRAIADAVHTKTAKDCLERFRLCRSRLVQQAHPPAGPPLADPPPADPPPEGPPPAGPTPAGPTPEGPPTGPLPAGQEVWLRGLELVGLTTVTMERLHVTVVCDQCGKRCSAAVDATGCGGADPERCSSCKRELALTIRPCLATAEGQMARVALVLVENGQLSAVNPSNYKAQCAGCGSFVKFHEVYSATRRTAVCRKCYARPELQFEAVELRGQQPPRRHPALAKKPKDVFKLKVGDPLPLLGTCSHYKKSFRWFRFPCCATPWPCDVCHDRNSDHPAQFAARVICGFCSRERPSNQTELCACGAQTAPAKASTHWEGGLGCRDPVRMSRKDNKKYKLMARKK